MVQTGMVDPTLILTQRERLPNAIEACKHFDRREPAWLTIELWAA